MSADDDTPITDRELGHLRLIIGGAADDVITARRWCEQHHAEITSEHGRFICRRGADELATGADLGVLLRKLERLEP
jgi:hypothetical protein